MKKIFTIVFLLTIVSCVSFAKDKTKTVAVIDTGFRFSELTNNVKLCQYGHKDFSGQNIFQTGRTKIPVPKDTHGHGTNIVGLIQKFAGQANYCIVIVKFWNPQASDNTNAMNSVRAIRYAVSLDVDYINFSGGGAGSNYLEKSAIRYFLDKGGKFIAAAGNEKSNINLHPYYPAMYDSRIISVGSTDEEGNRLPSSNYGPSVKKWEIGLNQEAFGIKMTGTSQATAIVTGKIINKECAK